MPFFGLQTAATAHGTNDAANISLPETIPGQDGDAASRAGRLDDHEVAQYAAAVGISENEARDAIRVQLAVGRLQAHLLRSEREAFAGLWFEPYGRRVHVRFVDASEVRTLRGAAAVGYPEPDALVPEPAQFSLIELSEVQGQIEAEWQLTERETGADLISVAVDVALNRLVIGVHGLDRTSEDALRQRFPTDMLVLKDVEESLSFRSSHCDNAVGGGGRYNCMTYTRGGIAAVNMNRPGTGFCTYGFGARNRFSSERYTLTNAHCNAIGDRYDHRGSFVGIVRRRALPVPNGAAGQLDVALVRDESLSFAPRNWVYHTDSAQQYQLVGSVSKFNISRGMLLCTAGITSNAQCNWQVGDTRTAVEVEEGGNSYVFTDVFQMLVTTGFGDSGSPVYAANRAYGMVFAGNFNGTYAMYIDNLQSQLGISILDQSGE